MYDSTLYPKYSLDASIAEFFLQTSATREECDVKARELVGGEVVPIPVQGICSYSVYAGPTSEFVVQFRLKSLMLKMETVALAREIYGSLVPDTSFHGYLGEGGKETLAVYVMNRIRDMSYLDFILENGSAPENSEENFVWRKTLMSDVARFFAISWKAPQHVDLECRENLRQRYTNDLDLLLHHLPPRFHQIIQKCLDSMEAIVSLPMVLVHHSFNSDDIIIDRTSCRLVGVVDWAEAEICPFGQNLKCIQGLTGALHLKNGWRRYEDYESLQDTFWSIFQEEVGGLSAETMETIKTARIMGLLRTRGFTARLANMPPATPIGDDERGRYNMLSLDGFLINPATRFEDLN
ncbi:uncharacterized protein GGS22DRAFT_163806 [Annulohypoxylon maeteangense]|uniref:uncharacterized protein n=1 Tax=Annulohypoxylon maeteangense TaxID=1927788 RepID=UPI0020080B7B|nr:uncharacterized protein GGS22DRAFT_163806 [Annulohypoxylon maeteangense]KAI0884563.1 hypothetical protein GGS22DRAFT_163806 [Annulohypoxylon maeteangense]